MNIRSLLALGAASIAVAACGGGGSSAGPVISAPNPAPTPAPAPPPTPGSATNPDVSYTFPNDATKLTGTWDLTSATAFQGAAASAPLTIRYDAASGSYTLTDGAVQQSFGSADVVAQDNVEVRYRKTGAEGTNYLTLVKTPYSNTSKPQYVAMGFWQRNAVQGSSQGVQYNAFTYGVPTAATAVPRTGRAAFGIDVFGLVTKPGEEPASFQGGGQLSVDFAEGIFSTETYVTEYGLVSDRSASGGGVEFRAGGLLSATSGAISGTAVYGSFYGTSSGKIAGQFFGPSGQEVGASFTTAGADGLAAVGSLVGVRNPSLTPANQTLKQLTYPQSFFTIGGSLYGNINYLNAETFDFGAPVSDMLGGRFTAENKVASANPNFTTYAKSGEVVGYGQRNAMLRLYKPGPANTEIPLTYASFGHYSSPQSSFRDYFFTYGFQTGRNFLAARTGTASYTGVLYGTGLNSDASRKYDITGTSSFSVDFAAQRVNGTLSVNGREQTLGIAASFGDYGVTGALGATNSVFEAAITRGSANLGNLWAQFYGPDAQELAGTFYFNAPAGTGEALEVGIQGATVSRRN